MVAKTRVTISHHNRRLVHTYVQGNATPCGTERLPILEEIETVNLKVNRQGFSAGKSRFG
jgi:hypothetical protein